MKTITPWPFFSIQSPYGFHIFCLVYLLVFLIIAILLFYCFRAVNQVPYIFLSWRIRKKSDSHWNDLSSRVLLGRTKIPFICSTLWENQRLLLFRTCWVFEYLHRWIVMLKMHKMMALTICINIYMIFVLLSFWAFEHIIPSVLISYWNCNLSSTCLKIDLSTGLVVAHWLFFLVVKYKHYGNDFIRKVFLKGFTIVKERKKRNRKERMEV